MFTRPAELSDDDVAEALRQQWGLAVDAVRYEAVGFGSHHWTVTAPSERWFATVDDLDANIVSASDSRRQAEARLSTALGVARALADAGLDFVVAPVPAGDGGLVVPLPDSRFVVALYPFIDGTTPGFGQPRTQHAIDQVLGCLAAVHAAPGKVADLANRDGFVIPKRDELVSSLGALPAGDGQWGPGPHADAACRFVRGHGDVLRAVLGAYDSLATRVGSAPERFVVTHGEPHAGNTIVVDGVIRLIDWDTALLAPPERDLWSLVDEDPSVLDRYAELTGRVADDDALRLYRLWWDLCEVSLYTADLRCAHSETPDTEMAWIKLREHLDPARWADLI